MGAYHVIDLSTIGGGLALQPDAAVDLHLHTYASDGGWAPRELVDYLVERNFRVAAVCDHDTQRSVAEAIAYGAERGLTVIPGVEITSAWRDRQLHILVYGIHPDSNDPDAGDFKAVVRDLDNDLIAKAEDARQRIEASGKPIPLVHELHGDRPMWPFHVLMAAIKAGHVKNLTEAANLVVELGGSFSADQPVERVVAAARKAGGICVVAHPGRADAVGIVTEDDLDALLQEAPMHGIEAHYRSYTDAQTAQFRAIAQARSMLISCGSDSHAPNQPVNPRPWQAAWCADLLAHFGITVDGRDGEIWAEGMDPDAAKPEPEKQPETEPASEPVGATTA
jgi:predicted metal-dependent phosphoesterase TrpH